MDGGTGEANAGPEEWGDPERGDAPPPEDAFVVDLEGFEGPLDLLLALARTQKVDLARISIDTLVTQYLAYIREAQKLRLELAADYLVMAAWLAFLKSRLLLPRDEKAEDGPSGEELAARLAFRLMRLEAMRNAAAQLLTRKRLDRDIFPRGMPEGVKTIRTREHSAEIYDLLKAYAEQRTRTAPRGEEAHRVVDQGCASASRDAHRPFRRLMGAARFLPRAISPITGAWPHGARQLLRRDARNGARGAHRDPAGGAVRADLSETQGSRRGMAAPGCRRIAGRELSALQDMIPRRRDTGARHGSTQAEYRTGQ